MGGCMGQWVGSGQMTYLIKLELINIIWFCLKIYNLLRHPYLWVDGWVKRWAHVKPLKSNKSWPNRDNSIMDILDILLDILLKPPQPFIGLFFLLARMMHLHRVPIMCRVGISFPQSLLGSMVSTAGAIFLIEGILLNSPMPCSITESSRNLLLRISRSNSSCWHAILMSSGGIWNVNIFPVLRSILNIELLKKSFSMGQIVVMWFLFMWVGSLFFIMSLTWVFIRSGTYHSKLILLDVLVYSIKLSVSIPVSSTTLLSTGFCGSMFCIDVGSPVAGVGLSSGPGHWSGLLHWASIIDLVWTPVWLSAMVWVFLLIISFCLLRIFPLCPPVEW